MLVKIVLVFSLFGLVLCESEKDFKIAEVPSPFYELPCLAFGGLCLQKGECPEGKDVGLKGLCPRQQNEGVECCYSVAKSDRTCRRNGGECWPSSSRCQMTFSKASDCADDQKCCILVH